MEDEHDHSDKEFLGEIGDWDGYDVVDIIVKQPAAARFISRHMYNYFVSDEPPVSGWNEIPPKDPEAINVLVGGVPEFGRRYPQHATRAVQLGLLQGGPLPAREDADGTRPLPSSSSRASTRGSRSACPA